MTEKGYGKRTPIQDYRMTHRGSKGVKALNITEKNGNIVSFKLVTGTEDIMIITDSGIIIRLPLEQISVTGRVAQGVKLINLNENTIEEIEAKRKEKMDNIIKKYGISQADTSRVDIMARICNDAVNLDTTRFVKRANYNAPGEAFYGKNDLKTETAKKLIRYKLWLTR